MLADENPTVQRLMETVFRFRRLHWRQSPIAGLTGGEVMVLSCVQKAAASSEAGIKVSEISNYLRVASPTITQQVNDLEAHGFVERSMDKEDRRAVRVRLTGKGECAVQKAREAFLESFRGLVEYLGEEDSATLAELLSKASIYFHETRDSERLHTW